MEQIKTLEGQGFEGLIHFIGQRIRNADKRRVMAYEEVGKEVLLMASDGDVGQGQSELLVGLGVLFENLMLDAQSNKNGFSETS